MAQQAIDAIHGQHTLPEATEPLVVRWADAPGTRKRDVREGGRKNRQGGGGGGSGASRDGGWNNMVPMRFNGMSYGSYPQQTAQMGQMHAQQLGGMGGSFGATYYGAQHPGMEGCYSSGPGMMPCALHAVPRLPCDLPVPRATLGRSWRSQYRLSAVTPVRRSSSANDALHGHEPG